jgi:hypothetical protein
VMQSSVPQLFFLTHGTPNFNNGSWGHATKFRLTEKETKQHVPQKMRMLYVNL